jgi:hypothetical protein
MPEPLTPGYTTPVYIAGPMRGRPEMGFPAFLDAAQRLRALGYEVKCPAEPDPDAGFDPHDLRPALASVLSWIVLHAGAVVVLPGWEQSKGCRAEIAAAQAVGTPVYELDAFLSRGGDAPRVGGQPQTPDRLAEIRERHEAATEGPWWFDESDLTWRLHGVAGVIPPSADGLIPEQIVNKQILKAPKKGTTYAEYWPDDADAAFISHAWEDVRRLLAELDAAQEKLRKIDACPVVYESGTPMVLAADLHAILRPTSDEAARSEQDGGN